MKTKKLRLSFCSQWERRFEQLDHPPYRIIGPSSFNNDK